MVGEMGHAPDEAGELLIFVTSRGVFSTLSQR